MPSLLIYKPRKKRTSRIFSGGDTTKQKIILYDLAEQKDYRQIKKNSSVIEGHFVNFQPRSYQCTNEEGARAGYLIEREFDCCEVGCPDCGGRPPSPTPPTSTPTSPTPTPTSPTPTPTTPTPTTSTTPTPTTPTPTPPVCTDTCKSQYFDIRVPDGPDGQYNSFCDWSCCSCSAYPGLNQSYGCPCDNTNAVVGKADCTRACRECHVDNAIEPTQIVGWVARIKATWWDCPGVGLDGPGATCDYAIAPTDCTQPYDLIKCPQYCNDGPCGGCHAGPGEILEGRGKLSCPSGEDGVDCGYDNNGDPIPCASVGPDAYRLIIPPGCRCSRTSSDFQEIDCGGGTSCPDNSCDVGQNGQTHGCRYHGSQTGVGECDPEHPNNTGSGGACDTYDDYSGCKLMICWQIIACTTGVLTPCLKPGVCHGCGTSGHICTGPNSSKPVSPSDPFSGCEVVYTGCQRGQCCQETVTETSVSIAPCSCCECCNLAYDNNEHNLNCAECYEGSYGPDGEEKFEGSCCHGGCPEGAL